MSIRRWLGCVSVSLFLARAIPAGAQEQYSSVEGIITDASGALLTDVRIDLVSATLAGLETARTDFQGTYRFPSIPPGSYEVRASRQGFAPSVTAINVGLGELRVVDIRLAIDGVQETIQVTAPRRPVDVRQSTSGFNLSSVVLQGLPHFRNPPVTFAPGVNYESRLAGISIGGSSGSENQFVTDGVTTTSLREGNVGRGIALEVMDELQVKSSGPSAEHSGTTGGVINVVTRTGGAAFQGSAGIYVLADEFDGGTRPVLRRNPLSPGVAEYVAFETDDSAWFEPSMTFGGPLLTDRLWFFAGYLPYVGGVARTTNLSDNSRGTFQNRRRVHDISGTLSSRLGESIRLRFSALGMVGRSEGVLPNAAYHDERGTSDPLYPWAAVGSRDSNNLLSGRLDFAPTNRLFLEIGGGYHRTSVRDTGVPGDLRYSFQVSNVGLMDVPPALQRPLFFSNLATNYSRTRDVEARFALNASVSAFGQWGGRHAFKAGFQFERQGSDLLVGNQNEVVLLFWNRTYFATDGRASRGRYGYYSHGREETEARVSTIIPGLFVQDTWTPGRRLTLNLGLRTERERIPSYDVSHGQAPIAFEFGFGDKLAPRVSFAYDLTSDGRWLAYGSYGRFFDIMKRTLPLYLLGGNSFVETFRPLDTFDWPAIGVAGFFPGSVIERLDYVLPLNIAGPETVGGIDPEIKPYEQDEWTLGLVHEMPQALTAGVRIMRRHLLRALEDVGIIVPGVGERYYIGNPGFGVTRRPRLSCGGPCPDLPRAVRQFDALELTLTKGFRGRWFLDASYLWSRLWGNYSGLIDSDDPGHISPNVNRVFDASFSTFDQSGSPAFGPLPTDRPHQLKAQGFHVFAFGTTLGARVSFKSGTPVQTQGSNFAVPFLPHGRGDLGRTPGSSQTDLLLQHDVQVRGAGRLRFSTSIANLFDQDTPSARVASPYLQSLNLTEAQFFRGFDFDSEARRLGLERNPLFDFDGGYGLGAYAFQAPRTMRVGLTFLF